jgi:phospholipase C
MTMDPPTSSGQYRTRRNRWGSRWIDAGSNPMTLVLTAVVVLSMSIPYTVVGSFAAVSGNRSLPPSSMTNFDAKIQHIVLVVLENHAYDDYFGTYCQSISTVCPHVAAGIPSGTCVPLNPANLSSGCVRPFNFTAKNWSITSGMAHSWISSLASYHNGSMNGFYRAEASGLDPFGHYNGSTAPLYWDLAQEYGLGDHFFSSVLDYSLPNHWHIVAGAAPQEILKHYIHAGIQTKAWIGNATRYLKQANATPAAEDLLDKTNVSWKYYDRSLPTYQNATYIHNASVGPAYGYFDPMAAKAESYSARLSPHFVNNTDFYTDARNGALPSISWVMPNNNESDHPPYNVTFAEGWLASLVDAVESSPDWNTTAMFVTWDDYGGFYDHLAPPLEQGNRTGFRVPLLVISPYTPAGLVVHQTAYFESVLRLMELRFNLGCLTPMDCKAPVPLGYFNFSHGPRPPILFSGNTSTWTYPMPPTGQPVEFTPIPPYDAPDAYFHLTSTAPDVD